MDVQAEQQKLEEARKIIVQWLEHPVTKKIFADNKAEQERLINLFTLDMVSDLQSFFAREQAFGHLRGLRRAKSIVDDDLEEIEKKLKELQ